ncbi:MAG: hypothetical protein M1609_15060 [Firmicutes bacterium]|nr:hypothetical protein [Bacillota bacterium]
MSTISSWGRKSRGNWAIKKATAAEAVIADVNDKKCVDILGITDRGYLAAVKEALRDNPFGNEDEQTPIVILKSR